MSTTKPTPDSILAHLKTVAAEAQAQLTAIEKSLALRAAFTAKEKQRVLPLLRITPEAMNVAADLVRRQPAVFGSLDTTAMQTAAEYELVMAPLRFQLEHLAAAVHESIIAAKAPAAAQTLDVYAVAKPLARLKQGASMLPQIAMLKSLVRTTIKHRTPKSDEASAEPEAAPKT
jgi:hypothetical protein